MSSSIRERFEEWKLDELLQSQPGLTVRPKENGRVRLAGLLTFSAEAAALEQITDAYEVEIAVPSDFPRDVPVVRETGGRIPKDFHTNPDGGLCLGSPLRQRLALVHAPTLPDFVTACLVPFLYGFSYRERHGHLPFGELDHGKEGLRRDFAAYFGLEDENAPVKMVRLAAMKKRVANKHLCPCEGGRRLGKCHNRYVNRLRAQLGRSWCRVQYHGLVG
jgi:hypothetical protein